jgi:hypothetical protein
MTDFFELHPTSNFSACGGKIIGGDWGDDPNPPSLPQTKNRYSPFRRARIVSLGFILIPTFLSILKQNFVLFFSEVWCIKKEVFWKIDRFKDAWYAFFVNFQQKNLYIFLKRVDNRISKIY